MSPASNSSDKKYTDCMGFLVAYKLLEVTVYYIMACFNAKVVLKG